ncbi:MAG: DUF58 domain-containing protein [Planctomycetes bacterium]|nr:DUF58 domain-containing protein [Planctomycetota bacterium]
MTATASNPTAAPWFSRLVSRFRRSVLNHGGPEVITQVMQDGNPNRYLDPKVIARFGLSPLIAHLVVEGFISGLHKSPFHGFSVEFADHREYVPGDDLKFLDWQLFARTDHYYVKRYEEETNLRCHILMDRSASMAFGTNGLTKWDYGCFLATCLAHMMMKQQDAAGLTLFGAKPGLILPPRTRSSHLRQMMQVMINNPPEGTTDMVTSLRATVRNLKRRSLIVLISDLIDDPEETLSAIKLLGAHRHDVIVFHLQDPVEIDLSFDGSTLLCDMETGEELEVDPASLREAYQEKVRETNEFYKKGLTGAGIDYQPINTTQPYDHALWAYLQRRALVGK